MLYQKEGQTKTNGSRMWVALPITHFARRHMAQILKSERA
jgi:hypothetical protein